MKAFYFVCFVLRGEERHGCVAVLYSDAGLIFGADKAEQPTKAEDVAKSDPGDEAMQVDEDKSEFLVNVRLPCWRAQKASTSAFRVQLAAVIVFLCFADGVKQCVFVLRVRAVAVSLS